MKQSRVFITALMILGLMSSPSPALADDASTARDQEVDAGFLHLQTLDRRVATVAYRLALASLPLCEKRMLWPGFTLHYYNQYQPAYRERAARAFELDPRYPGILALVPGSAAQTGGLSQNDVITAINGHSLKGSEAQDGKGSYAEVDKALSRMESAPVDKPLVIAFRHRDEAGEVRLTPAIGCASRVEISPGGGLDAGANGRIVQIDGKMADWIGDDDELAFLIAHEMAHNILGHRDRLKRQKVPDGLFALFGKNAARIRATEEEADYVGLYMMYRAGYALDGATSFWNRYVRSNPLSFLGAPTHPSIGSRKDMIEQVKGEIAAKVAAGQAILPNGFPTFPVPSPAFALTAVPAGPTTQVNMTGKVSTDAGTDAPPTP